MLWPKISIVMPAFNCEKTIEKAIKSVLDQCYPNLEFIIMDGGSTDRTVEIIKSYEKYLAYWQSERDGNPSIACNAGISMATGTLVALLMADDWYDKQTLQKIADAFIQHPDADMITCGGRVVSFDPSRSAYQVKLHYNDEKCLALNIQNICFGVSAICSRFIRKSLFDRIGYFDVCDAEGKHIFSNDKAFLLRAMLCKAKNIFVPYVGHYYLSHAGSSTFGNNHQNTIRLCEEHLWIAESFLKQSNLSPLQRFLLHYWHNDQSTRLLLYRLLDAEVVLAKKVAYQALRQYAMIWVLLVPLVISKILLKKSMRLFKRMLHSPDPC